MPKIGLKRRVVRLINKINGSVARYNLTIGLVILVIVAFIGGFFSLQNTDKQHQLEIEKEKATFSPIQINCKGPFEEFSEDGLYYYFYNIKTGIQNDGGGRTGKAKLYGKGNKILCKFETAVSEFENRCETPYYSIQREQLIPIFLHLKIPKDINTFNYEVYYQYWDESVKAEVNPIEISSCKNCEIHTRDANEGQKKQLQCEN